MARRWGLVHHPWSFPVATAPASFARASMPAQFGSLKLSSDDLEKAAKDICALDATATTARFASAGDASKSANFCGDVIYLSVLLDKLGFNEHKSMTMTNKIKDVEAKDISYSGLASFRGC